jgi:CheY-like chemotaxis protein
MTMGARANEPTIDGGAAEAVDSTSLRALVVAGDGVSRRFVELALGGEDDFVIETANDAASALEVLRMQVVDVIISDTDLPDINGLSFFRRLSQERRLRDIPFVFLSDDAHSDTKTVAFEAGVDDYLTKPCSARELLARAHSLVQKRARQRELLRARAYTFAGDLSAIAFPDLVAILDMGRRSGILSVVTPKRAGEVFFEEGRVVHAVYGNILGESAFYQFITNPGGRFEFTPSTSSTVDCERTITSSTTALIMEGVRQLDSLNRYRPGRVATEGPVTAVRRHVELQSTRPPDMVQPAPALEADTVLAAQYELAVRDPFALGELKLFSHDELARWTLAGGGRDRLHVHVVADLAAGVSSILTLGGSPTERWVLSSLSGSPKVLGLTFFFRHERTLDVVLIDARDPCAFQRALMRTPAFVVLAPPDGDLMSVGTKAHVALESYLRRLGPLAITGVGNGALETNVRALAPVVDLAPVVRCTPGTLGDASTELRDLLIKGIRLWATTKERLTERPTVRPPS